jgi:hypothetical protein
MKLAVGSLVLGQLHSLYGAFAGLVLGPVLAITAAARVFRRRRDGWRLAVCVAALAAALPFLLVSKLSLPPSAATPMAAGGDKEHSASDDSARGSQTMAPRAGWGTLSDWRAACLAGGIVCAVAGRRRKEALLFLAIVGMAALVLYVPPVCATALRIFEKKWILGRMGFVLHLGFIGLVPCAAAFLVEPKTRYWWVRSILSLLVLLSAVGFPNRTEPYTWRTYCSKVTAPRREREAYLIQTDQVVAFCRRHIPRGITVLVDSWRGMVLTMIHDCHIVLPYSAGNGIPDRAQRRKDLIAMLAADTPWHDRRELLRKYGISLYFPAGTPTNWTEGHIKAIKREPGFRLFILDTEQ